MWVKKACVSGEMLDAVRRHRKTRQHADACAAAAQAAAKSMAVHVAEANSALVSTFVKRLRSLYWLVQQNQPVLKMSSLLELEVRQGAYGGGLEAVLHGERQKYDAANITLQFQRVLADCVRASMTKEFQGAEVRLDSFGFALLLPFVTI